MGLVHVDGEIGPSQDQTAPVRFMADTGSLYTVISPELAAQLGLHLTLPHTLVMADGSSVNGAMGLAWLRVGDREGGTVVVATEVIEPLLGAVSMQALGLNVNMQDEVIEFNGRYPPPV